MNKLNKLVVSIGLSVAMILSFAAPSFAQSEKVDFLDVSHYNSEQGLPLSFYQVVKEGLGTSGICIKVSEGNNVRDKSAGVNAANIKAANLRLSAYHFARLTSEADAIAEANWFDKNLRAIGFSKTDDSQVVIDVETATASKEKLTDYVNRFIREMYALGYIRVDIYSGASFYKNHLIPSKLIVKQNWLARYAYDGVRVLDPGQDRGAHQWTSQYKLKVNGATRNFDANIDYAGKYTDWVKTPVGKIGNVSLVNYLKSKKVPTSFSYRNKLAVAYSIVVKYSDYRGSAAQNIALKAKLQSVNFTKSTKLPTPLKAPIIKQRNPSQYLSKNTKKITTKKTVYLYKSTNFANKYRVAKFKKGTIFTITSSKLSPTGYLRFKVKSGLYITANKSFVKTYSQPSHKATKKVIKTTTYKVVKGDSLWKISQNKKVSISKLKSLNKIHGDLIHVGQVLKLK